MNPGPLGDNRGNIIRIHLFLELLDYCFGKFLSIYHHENTITFDWLCVRQNMWDTFSFLEGAQQIEIPIRIHKFTLTNASIL